MPTVRNYGKTWSFVPETVAYPTCAEELVRLVRGANKVRAMGSRHSWSQGIVTGDTLISLDRMNRLLETDAEAGVARVQAGIKLKDLIVQLEARGLALANLGSISAQSLAGAISTGTHGTGIGFPCLAAQVESLALIDGQGNERRYRRGDAAFDGVVVGLGCVGVVHEMTLKVVPTFQMHAVTDSVRFDELIENLESYVRGHDHFKFWWLVPDERVIVFMNNRTDRPRNDSDVVRWFKDEVIGVAVYRSLVLLGKLHRQALIPRMNAVLTREGGQRFDRVCKSHVGFLTPAPPVHREAEWAFDYADATRLLREYRALLLKSGYAYNFIQEVRFTKGDEFWLSPAYRRDSIWLSLYNMDSDERWNAQRARFDAFAMEHGGRPHWGKEARFDAAYLDAQLPMRGEFPALMKDHDPGEKFINAWAEQIRGASSRPHQGDDG